MFGRPLSVHPDSMLKRERTTSGMKEIGSAKEAAGVCRQYVDDLYGLPPVGSDVSTFGR